MRSFTTRLIILIAAILIAIIIGMQVNWLNKNYSFEKNEFNTSVLKSIRGVYEDIPLLYNPAIPLDTLVERPGESNFLFGVDSIPLHDTLLRALREELEDFHVFTDCRFAVFDHRKHINIYEDYISADASKRNEDTVSPMPVFQRNFSYVHLYFPNRHTYLIREMRTWIYSSVVLLLLLIGFALAIYYFMKQKFLVEIQKDFINNVTHEFSTPLSVIDLSVEGLEKESTFSNPEKYSRYVQSIRYQSAYLNNHLTNLIKTVVVGPYHLPLHKKEIIPGDLLKRAVFQLEPLLARKNGEVIWDLRAGEIKLRADEENLYLALFNIINNSIKYSDQPKVIISTFLADERYQISVKDNGVGIEPSQVKKIFRKFYRARGQYHVKGLGLGLYFTKKVISGHRGHIKVNSVPGIGTEFVIDLPLKFT